MTGPRQVDQAALFYEFSLEGHFMARPAGLRLILNCSSGWCRSATATAFVPSGGRAKVLLNLANRWFCRLGLDGEVPDHSPFFKNSHGRFRKCDLLGKLFDTVVRRRTAEGLVDRTAFAVDASLIASDANKQCAAAGSDEVDCEAIARTLWRISSAGNHDLQPLMNGTACPILSCQFGTMFTDPAAPQTCTRGTSRRA